MKLRQHKQEHIERMRRRILHRRGSPSPLQTSRVIPADSGKRFHGARITGVWIDELPCLLDTELPEGLRIEAGANGATVAHVDGSKVSAAALIAMADMVPSSTSGTLEVAMTAEQRQRALRVIEKVWREDPRRFTFSPKLPRR